MTGILDKWVYFIKHASNLDVVPESADTSALKAAYEVANRFSWSRRELEVYDYWQMKAQDERGKLQAALKEGREEGREEGLEEGLEKGHEKGLEEGHEKGLEEGLEKGRQDAQKEMARNMLAEGFSPEMIARVSPFSLAEIKEIGAST